MKKICSLYWCSFLICLFFTNMLYGQLPSTNSVVVFNVACPEIFFENITGKKLPNNFRRTSLGVGEYVRLWMASEYGKVTWKITKGDGKIVPLANGDVVFKAPLVASNTEITAFPEKSCLFNTNTPPVLFNVIPPTKITWDLACDLHIEGRNSAGMVTGQWLMPHFVSFENLQVGELEIGCVAEGALKPWDGTGHTPGPYGKCTEFIIPNYGTSIVGQDCATAATFENEPELSSGTLYFDIPWVYQNKGATPGVSPSYPIETIRQTGKFSRFSKDGKSVSEMQVGKAGLKVTTLKSDATIECSDCNFKK
jgi:hypothetical protein